MSAKLPFRRYSEHRKRKKKDEHGQKGDETVAPYRLAVSRPGQALNVNHPAPFDFSQLLFDVRIRKGHAPVTSPVNKGIQLFNFDYGISTEFYCKVF